MSIRERFEEIDTITMSISEKKQLDYMEVVIGVERDPKNGSYYTWSTFTFYHAKKELTIFNDTYSSQLIMSSFFEKETYPLDDPVIAKTIIYYILKVKINSNQNL